MAIDPRAVVVLVMLATAAPARAEVHLDAGLGFGVAAYDPCAYPDARCDEPKHRVLGFAPLAGIGARALAPLGQGWKLRYGGSLVVLVIPEQPVGPAGHASVTSGIAEIGMQNDRWTFDLGMGLSRIHLEQGMTTATSVSFLFGFAAGLRVSEDLTLVARADMHAVMHGESAALFIGAGLQWTPHL